IRAAIVAQLAKPATASSWFWRATKDIQLQLLTWSGIVGGTITLFGNLSSVVDLADWAQVIVMYWHEWTQMFWSFVFALVSFKLPKEFASPLSFTSFVVMLAIGTKRSSREEFPVRAAAPS